MNKSVMQFKSELWEVATKPPPIGSFIHDTILNVVERGTPPRGGFEVIIQARNGLRLHNATPGCEWLLFPGVPACISQANSHRSKVREARNSKSVQLKSHALL